MTAGVRARHDLLDVGELAGRIARIDALRRIAEIEVDAFLEARDLLDHRQAALFRGARIDGAFEHHDAAALQMLADGARGREERSVVRPVMAVHRSRHADDDDIGLTQGIGIRGEIGIGDAQFLAVHFSGEVDAAAQFFDLGLRDVETDGARGLGETENQRQARHSRDRSRPRGTSLRPAAAAAAR